jgi:hypothetical protein
MNAPSHCHNINPLQGSMAKNSATLHAKVKNKM